MLRAEAPPHASGIRPNRWHTDMLGFMSTIFDDAITTAGAAAIWQHSRHQNSPLAGRVLKSPHNPFGAIMYQSVTSRIYITYRVAMMIE